MLGIKELQLVEQPKEERLARECVLWKSSQCEKRMRMSATDSFLGLLKVRVLI
jgi:hypothetical protein